MTKIGVPTVPALPRLRFVPPTKLQLNHRWNPVDFIYQCNKLWLWWVVFFPLKSNQTRNEDPSPVPGGSRIPCSVNWGFKNKRTMPPMTTFGHLDGRWHYHALLIFDIYLWTASSSQQEDSWWSACRLTQRRSCQHAAQKPHNSSVCSISSRLCVFFFF